VHTIQLSVSDDEFIRNVTIVIHIFSINQNMDTDSDGIPDYWENLYNFNINDPHDAEDDLDKDTFSNWEEYMAETDPRNPKSTPDEHISRETKKAESDDSIVYFGIFGILMVVMIVIIIFIIVWNRRKKDERGSGPTPGSTEGIIGMSPGDRHAQPGYGKYQPPKVVCHKCGKTLKILTLNRPVAVTCTDCGFRGAVY
jgi:hypothetical protein